MPEVLLIGSNNRGKAAELADLLHGLPWDVRALSDFDSVPSPEEDGLTFEANAVKKARYFGKCFGVCCVADDSGLQVDALDGAPGIYSARFAGPQANDAANNAKLLAALASHPESERTARFVCCVAFVRPGRQPHVETGTVEGRIALAPRGSHGFGYDSLFVPDGEPRTFGEIPRDEKRAISHRGRALAKLRAYLETGL